MTQRSNIERDIDSLRAFLVHEQQRHTQQPVREMKFADTRPGQLLDRIEREAVKTERERQLGVRDLALCTLQLAEALCMTDEVTDHYGRVEGVTCTHSWDELLAEVRELRRLHDEGRPGVRELRTVEYTDEDVARMFPPNRSNILERWASDRDVLVPVDEAPESGPRGGEGR